MQHSSALDQNIRSMQEELSRVQQQLSISQATGSMLMTSSLLEHHEKDGLAGENQKLQQRIKLLDERPFISLSSCAAAAALTTASVNRTCCVCTLLCV